LTSEGPDPYLPARPGAVAQLVERLVRNEKVSGSIPLSSTRTVRDIADSLCPGAR
jgi:hypothetical protein